MRRAVRCGRSAREIAADVAVAVAALRGAVAAVVVAAVPLALGPVFGVCVAAAAVTAAAAAPTAAAAATTTATSTAAPAITAHTVTVTDDRGRRLTLAAPARRVVALLPSLTESVCALGACERLVGVDRFSNWPAAVTRLPRLGGLEDTQIERIVALKPDLVLAAGSTRALARLESLGLPVLALEPQDLVQTQRALRTLALALGMPEQGERVAEGLATRIEAAAARVPLAWRGRSVYLEVASTPHAAGAASFAGEVLARLGLVNIVPAALGAFPQLNPEFVLRAQPQLVLATAAALAEMPRRPGWAGLAALRSQRVCGFAPGPWDTLVRPGPRLAEAAEAVADCLAALPPPEGRGQ